MYLIYHMTDESMPSIARHFDRDNSTVNHAVHLIDDLLRLQPGLFDGLMT